MEKDRKGLSITSLIVGVVSFGAWLLPICGLPLSIFGLVVGILSRGSSRRKAAIAGIILCSISLVLGIANGVFGAFLRATMEQDILARELDAFKEAHPGAIVQEYSIKFRGKGEVLPIDAAEGVGSLYCYEVLIDYARDPSCDSYEVRLGLAKMYADGSWDYESNDGIGHDVWVEHACGDFTLSPPAGFCK